MSEEEIQIRKEQFRWKIGIAPAWMGEAANGSSRTLKRGSVEGASGTTGVASRSVPEDERGAAGTTGVCLSSEGLAQQARVEHLPHPAPQQELTGVVAGVELPAISPERGPGHAKTNPSSRATEIFPTRDVITLYWSPALLFGLTN